MRKRRRLNLESLDRRDCPAVFGNPWPDPNLTLSFAPDGTSINGVPSRFDTALANIPAEMRTNEILRAFQAWVAVANVNIGLVTDAGQPFGAAGTAFNDPRFGDIRIGAVPLSADNVALALPYDFAAGTRSGDVMFNSALPFAIGPVGGFDLFSVALHEAGHVFGLAGSADPTSAMFQIADRVRTGPNAADISAMRMLYGPRLPDAFEGSFGNSTIAMASQLRPENGAEFIDISADLGAPGDADVYEFEVDDLEGGAFLATLRTAGVSLVVPRLEILDATGTVLATGTGASPGRGDIALVLDNLEKGETYFARVVASDPVFSVGRYALELRPEIIDDDDDELDDDEVGEDDTPETSDSLERLPSLDGTRQNFFVAASLSTATDVDFYRVRSALPSGTPAGALSVSVVATTATIDPIVEILDELGALQSIVIVTRDGGETAVQLPNAVGNRDYFVAVRHGRNSTGPAGNYSLGIDFGGSLVPLETYATGELTPAAPAILNELTVETGRILHLVLKLESTPTPAAARFSIFDGQNRTIDTRQTAAGDAASANIFLPPGVYTLLVGGGATDGGPMPTIRYVVEGLTLSDPIGPQAVEPGTNPPPVVPPPIVVAPPRPATPTVPVAPTAPNILLIPPTDQPIAPTLRLRPLAPPPARTTAAASAGTVRSLNPDGTERFSFNPFMDYSGPLRVAEADANNDGIADILVGTGPGSASRVALFDGRTRGILFDFAPFESTFLGGVYVALGDLTGDGRADLVVTPDEGGGPRVRAFDGASFAPVADFFGIDDPAFRGGARAAIGDLNNDGVGDLIVAAGFAGGPRVAGYNGSALAAGRTERLFGDFFTFEETLRNGVFLAVADLDADGFADLVAGGGPGGGPRVLALSGRSLLTNSYSVLANFFAGDPTARDGVRLTAKNLDNDGHYDLVAHVGSRVIGYSGASLSPNGVPVIVLEATPFGGNRSEGAVG
ncbi:MAG: VCBS repeat-containing protein [Gemmataceae bacterium]|nr:VCBS repeat-containing protein [Gemmataceae bacterium]